MQRNLQQWLFEGAGLQPRRHIEQKSAFSRRGPLRRISERAFLYSYFVFVTRLAVLRRRSPARN
jgi:hypothetical protein